MKVGPDLSLPGHPEIFVIGDTAAVTDQTGQPVPGIASAAKQMGHYVGKLIAARIAGRAAPGRSATCISASWRPSADARRW